MTAFSAIDRGGAARGGAAADLPGRVRIQTSEEHR